MWGTLTFDFTILDICLYKGAGAFRSIGLFWNMLSDLMVVNPLYRITHSDNQKVLHAPNTTELNHTPDVHTHTHTRQKHLVSQTQEGGVCWCCNRTWKGKPKAQMQVVSTNSTIFSPFKHTTLFCNLTNNQSVFNSLTNYDTIAGEKYLWRSKLKIFKLRFYFEMTHFAF